MLRVKGIAVATVVCGLFSAVYAIYIAASALAAQLSSSGAELGLVEAFSEGTKNIDGFWWHLFEGWWPLAVLSFVCSVVVLAIDQR